ncbi:MAG: hypothetical protein JWO97_4156 [Acidobacteria bacterium]|nr:hypothetical protein [Acidobacteriota bacterium]
MTIHLLNAIATIASIAGFIGWIWQQSNHKGTPLTRWSTFVVSVLLLIVAGMGLSRFAMSPPAQVAAEGHAELTATAPPVTATTSIAAPAIAAPSPALVPHRDIERKRAETISIVDEQGKELTWLETAARDALGERIARVSASGAVAKQTSEPDAEMQGLITTTLRVHLVLISTSSGTIVHELNTEVRGGGFTESAAELQAMRRAAEAIRSDLAAAKLQHVTAWPGQYRAASYATPRARA